MSAPRTSPCWRIRLYATLALLVIGRFPDPASAAAPPPPPPPARPLRTEDWDLAWQAFVGAGALADAYRLAHRAVAARPRSRLWLGRLAQAAGWSNHPRAALAALSRLALDLHEGRDLQPALDLAIGLGHDGQAAVLLRSLIQQGRATAAQRRMLSGLYLDLGEPRQSIRELQREFARRHEPKLLWEQAVIYRTLGDPQRELATFQRYRKHFGPGPKVMLAIATIEYVQNRLPQAFDALLAARSRARPSDTAYWQTLSGLAWLLGDYRAAAQAAKVLIATDQADAPVYLRVVYAEQYRHPRQAFTVAARGWQRTHEPALFLSTLGIASSLHPATPWLVRAFALLGPGQAAAFAATPSYWSSLAALHSGQGRMRAALADYRQALRESPGDDSLLADCLWLLVDHHDLAPIAPRLHLLAQRARHAPQLWAPLAAAYAALHQPGRALPWLQAQWPARKDDPQWLIDYADTLQQAGRPGIAWQLRRRAYDLLSHRLTSRSSPRRVEAHFLALARLSLSLAPGDPARRAIEGLARQSRRQQARVTVLSWMQSEHAYSLARWWRRRAFVRAAPPDWARLAQAVAENDGPRIAGLLDRPSSSLPLRDRASAAEDLGWNASALSLAFQGLELEPHDAGLQRQFAAIAVRRADSLGAAAIATETSGLLDEGVGLQATHWLSPHHQLDIRIDTTHQRTIDSSQFGTPPSLSRAALLAWRDATARGSLTFDLGAGRNLAAWFRAGIAWQRRWSSALETTLGAIAGAQPLDTVALGVAGLEDRIDAGASARLTPRADLQLQLQAGRLRAQGGGTLGSVQRFSLAGDYQLWFSPPDFALNASLSGAHYARAASLPTQLTPLVPADETPTVGFFVPDSFVQACAGGHFNMRYTTAYTPQLRPYASASLCANSVSGQGYDLTAGIATPVSGPDHLSLTLNLENDVGTHSGRTAGVMLRYRHYFTSTQ
ncbi:MAG: tetratricopeptide repeat protein [Proteobacteria bacterium]|nr:tetratricopeptide repeat protein [Pseudomonadota bacterium]